MTITLAELPWLKGMTSCNIKSVWDKEEEEEEEEQMTQASAEYSAVLRPHQAALLRFSGCK
jgi:hypothetical protein